MDDAINRANLPTVLNGIKMSECDKVIEPFLEERSCDEVWHAVRALRDFYDWVMNENAIEPCEDTVSRKWLLNELEEMNVASFYEANIHSKEAYEDMKRMIKVAPSVTVEPKQGEWIFDDPLRADFMCSECLERNDICTNFCPNCGARMFPTQMSER